MCRTPLLIDLLLSNQDKGCTPSVAHSLPLPLGPALLNLWIECGRGAWKYNNSLLQDTEYLYKIRQCIENVKHLYAATPYSPVSISDIHASELDLIIDDQLFFEMLLLEIRGQSISYSVNCKKNRLDNERVLI